MTARLKLVLIGAGSTVFTQRLVADLILSGEADRWELALVDIDPVTLGAVDQLVRKMLALKGVDFPVVSTTDRRDVLAGADFVVTTIAVGGRRGWDRDVQVPRKYQIYQPVGDTMMPGGISRAMRMIPQMVAIAQDVADLCPEAYLLNYSNPMTAVCRGVRVKTGVPVIGLCHGVHYVEGVLARFLGCDEGSITSFGVGLNHLTFLTHIRCNGEDAMPMLKAKVDEQRPLLQQELRDKTDWPNVVTGKTPRCSDDPFAWSISSATACFLSPSIGTSRSSIPSDFRKGSTTDGHLESPLFPLTAALHLATPGTTRCSQWHDPLIRFRQCISKTSRESPNSCCRSCGHSAAIGGRSSPSTCPTEVPCPVCRQRRSSRLPAAAGAAGFAPLQSAPLPPALTAKLLSKIAAIEVTVEAALTGSFDMFVEALLTDGSVSDPDKAAALARDLVEAHREHLPQFA